MSPFMVMFESITPGRHIGKYNRIVFADLLESLVPDFDWEIAANGLNQLKVISSSWQIANSLLDSKTLKNKEYKTFIPDSLISYKALATYVEENISPRIISHKLMDEIRSQILSIRRRTNQDGSVSSKVEFMFSGVSVPGFIRISKVKFDLTMLVTQPKRRFKCQIFSHFMAQCRIKLPRCEYCAQNHLTTKCPNLNSTALCANCGKNHIASSRDCVIYKYQLQVMKIRLENNLSYTGQITCLYQQESTDPP